MKKNVILMVMAIMIATITAVDAQVKINKLDIVLNGDSIVNALKGYEKVPGDISLARTLYVCKGFPVVVTKPFIGKTFDAANAVADKEISRYSIRYVTLTYKKEKNGSVEVVKLIVLPKP